VIGLKSDLYQSPWGRRRPFALCGALGTSVALLALSWVEEFSRIFSDCFGACSAIPEQYVRSLTIAVAVVLVYCLNISVTTLQVALRTLVIEKCTQHQQVQASAWMSYMTGIGNIIGYIAGSTSLPEFFGTPSMSQFQWLCVWASVLVLVSTGLTCWSISEESFLTLAPSNPQRKTRAMLSSLLSTWRTMPVKIKYVCHVQFWSWMGWFPFLYYSTT
jgi:solute carrier family 45 protein 1/2/4